MILSLQIHYLIPQIFFFYSQIPPSVPRRPRPEPSSSQLPIVRHSWPACREATNVVQEMEHDLLNF